MAIKAFQSDDPQLVARFRQEVALSRKLAHPHVIRLYDLGTQGRARFLTMELLEGRSLDAHLGGPVDVATGVVLLLHACAGLGAAHAAGIVHRDIKPGNFFLTRAGALKLMDFGIAKRQSASEGLTAAGFIAGTPHYMAPEQQLRARDGLVGPLLHRLHGLRDVHGRGSLRPRGAHAAPDAAPARACAALAITGAARPCFARSGRGLAAREGPRGAPAELRVDPRAVAGLLLQACAGLGAAHARGIVHRDIKPANFFLTEDGAVKLMDFGIAKLQSARHGVTTAGFIAGTPHYMAPEQISNFSKATALSDLYAIGVMAFELLTGRVPFDHEDLMTLLMMHVREPAPSVRSVAPQVSAGRLDALVASLMEKDPGGAAAELRRGGGQGAPRRRAANLREALLVRLHPRRADVAPRGAGAGSMRTKTPCEGAAVLRVGASARGRGRWGRPGLPRRRDERDAVAPRGEARVGAARVGRDGARACARGRAGGAARWG